MINTIKAELVKELRDITSVSMMECKRALEQTNGDLNLAIDLLRKLGEATAVKKQNRLASEGLVVIKLDSHNSNKLALLEVNCETDFVAKNSNLLDFASRVVQIVLDTGITNVSELKKQMIENATTIEQSRLMLVNQLGENIMLRRAEFCEAQPNECLGYYLHGNAPSKIASVVYLEGGTPSIARDIAMHVAAMKPEYLSISDVPPDRYEKEKEIFMEQTKRENIDKAENILQKIIIGRVNKFFKEVTLLNQSFIKNPSLTIEELLNQYKAKVSKMLRIEVGENIS